jgi:hypothetical protein
MSDVKIDKRGRIHKGGIPSRQQHYNMVGKYFPLALKTLVDVMENSKHDSVRVSAANKIVDKVLPNLQAQTITDDNGKPVPIYNVVLNALQRNDSNTQDQPVNKAN